MRVETGEFLSRILVKARKKYRFAGVVFRGVSIGIIWPTKKEAPQFNVNQPELPFKTEER